MNQLAKIGRKQTILISISILLISLYTTYKYQSVYPEIQITKLISQIIRFLLTFGLLYLIYIGKKWAKVLIIVLFSISIPFALISLFVANIFIGNLIPVLVIVTIYSISIYHFAISKTFKAFFEYQNKKK
jgi:hypothetical protein